MKATPAAPNASSASNSPKTLSPAEKRWWRKVMRDFHVRAFGEELARINFLPETQRKAAVAEMIDYARSKGVKLGKPALGVTP